jgi:hypothetical protein
MTLHDPFVRSSLGGWRRRFHWRPRLRGLVPRGRGQAGPSAPVRRGYRRKLARIERGLVTDAPALTSLFTMFNQLSAGEQAAGVERVPVPGWPPPAWPRPPAYLAVLLALAAIMTLCLTLGSQVHNVRPCTATATAAPAAASGSPVRGLSCPAYANTKQ